MQKVVTVSFLATILFLGTGFTQMKKKAALNWISFEEAAQLQQEKPLPILIDVYTHWCGWCKVMDKKTYSKPVVIEYLNKKFYLIKFNAETKEPITWRGKTYTYNPQYRTHGLAVALLNGELAYPTTVFIPDAQSQPQPVPGFLETQELELMAKYFGEGHFGKTAFESYAKKFRPEWK